MRKIAAIILSILMLTGCAVADKNDIMNLLSSPQLSKRESRIVASLNEYLQSKILLKYPKRGNSISPVQIVDLNGDGKKQAVVLYSDPNTGGNLRLAVLGQADDGWQVISDREGYGTELYKIDFANITGDGRKRIVVGYTFSDGSNKFLSVYLGGSEDIDNSVTYSCRDFTVGDITGDGISDIVYAGASGDNRHTTITLLTCENGELVQKARAEIPFKNRKVTSIALTKNEYSENNGLVVDCSTPDHVVHTLYYYYGLPAARQPEETRDNTTGEENRENDPAAEETESAENENQTEEMCLVAMPNRDIAKYWNEDYNLVSIDLDMDKFYETAGIIKTSEDGYAALMDWTCYRCKTPVRKYLGICRVKEGIFFPVPVEWENRIEIYGTEAGGSVIDAKTGENLLDFAVVTVRDEIGDNIMYSTVGTLQVKFVFSEQVSDTQRSFITENLTYLK